MITLDVHHNIVALNKKLNTDYAPFVSAFLTKYEEVKEVDQLASFGSYKKYKTVKVLRNLYVEDNDNIYFPTGLLSIIPENIYKATYLDNVLKDPNVSFDEIKHSLDTFDLRNDQCIAVRKCLANKRGIIQMPTATGKSAIITSVIKQLQKVNPDLKVLALSPTISTASGLNDTFLENGLDSHVYGHPQKSLKQVNVALVQTLIAESNDDVSYLNDIGAVFYDECLPQGSLILLGDYSTATISEIYHNDSINSVMSFNLETNTYEPKPILKKHRTPFNDKFWRIKFLVTSTQEVGSISLTPNHKVYVKEKGYLPVTEIQCGDTLIYDIPELRGTVCQQYINCEVTNIFRGCGKKAEYKYNIEVAENHNYFADHVLVSNCHHLKCETWSKLNLLLQNAEYSLGFSALSIDENEIPLKDIRELSYESAKIIGSTGRVLLNMTPAYYIKNHIIATPVIFRVHNYISVPNNFNQHDYIKATKMAIKSVARKMYISKLAELYSRYNYKTLILVSEKDYGFEIAKQLVAHGVYNYGISYGSGEGYVYKSSRTSQRKGITTYNINYDKVQSLKVIEKFNNGEISVLIGTSHVDEGVDISNLDTVIISGSGKKDRRIIQRVGRSLRKSKTGKYAYVIDFTDDGTDILHKHSLERLDIYKEVIGVDPNLIYDNIEFNQIEPIFKKLENIQESENHDSIK